MKEKKNLLCFLRSRSPYCFSSPKRCVESDFGRSGCMSLKTSAPWIDEQPKNTRRKQIPDATQEKSGRGAEVMSETTSNPTSATNNTDPQAALIDKYNVETAEILANEAQVRSQIPTQFQFSLHYSVIDFDFNFVFLNFDWIQHLPISEAVPIYEQLLSVFPTAVSSLYLLNSDEFWFWMGFWIIYPLAVQALPLFFSVLYVCF